MIGLLAKGKAKEGPCIGPNGPLCGEEDTETGEAGQVTAG
jgi:hypothetical protein